MLWPGTACTVNGFIGQLSVQAADFSILVIAVVTLLTITRTTYMPAASTMRKCAICGSVWLVPLVTATVATAMGKMGPVSGNWCWILANRTDLRYALTHGWRIAIIFFTAGIYVFVWWYMNRHFRSMVSTMTGASVASKESWYRRRRGFKKMKEDRAGAGTGGSGMERSDDTELSTMSKSRISSVGVHDWELSAPEAALVRSSTELRDAGKKDAEANNAMGRPKARTDTFFSESEDDSDDDSHDDLENTHHHRHQDRGRRTDFDITPAATVTNTKTNHYHDDYQPPPPPNPQKPSTDHTDLPKSHFDSITTATTATTASTTTSEFPQRRQTRKMEREIKRMLLLNAYPIMYVILWVPGLVNRFMEATGRTGAASASERRALAALQASSQFVGLANAVTYGFNTALRTRVRRWWRSRRRGSADGGGTGAAGSGSGPAPRRRGAGG